MNVTTRTMLVLSAIASGIYFNAARAAEMCPIDQSCAPIVSEAAKQAWANAAVEETTRLHPLQTTTTVRIYNEPKTITEIVEVPVEVATGPSISITPYIGTRYEHTFNNDEAQDSTRGYINGDLVYFRDHNDVRTSYTSGLVVLIGANIRYGSFGAYGELSSNASSIGITVNPFENLQLRGGISNFSTKGHRDLDAYMRSIGDISENLAGSCSSSSDMPFTVGMAVGSTLQFTADAYFAKDSVDCNYTGQSGTTFNRTAHRTTESASLQVGIRYMF